MNEIAKIIKGIKRKNAIKILIRSEKQNGMIKHIHKIEQ